VETLGWLEQALSASPPATSAATSRPVGRRLRRPPVPGETGCRVCRAPAPGVGREGRGGGLVELGSRLPVAR